MSELEEDLKQTMKEIGGALSYTFNEVAITSKQVAEIISDVYKVDILYEDKEWVVKKGSMINNNRNVVVYKKVDDGGKVEKEISDLPDNAKDKVLKEII